MDSATSSYQPQRRAIFKVTLKSPETEISSEWVIATAMMDERQRDNRTGQEHSSMVFHGDGHSFSSCSGVLNLIFFTPYT